MKVIIVLVILFLKYGFSLFLVLMGSKTTLNPLYLLMGILELVSIFVLSNSLVRVSKAAGYILNAVVMLFFNIQYLVAYFGGSFVSPIMLDNLDSLEMLRGKAGLYTTGAMLVLFCSFLPHLELKLKNDLQKKILPPVLSTALAVQLVITTFAGNGGSPFYNLLSTVGGVLKNVGLASSVESLEVDESTFYKTKIRQYSKKPQSLPEKPNVVLIFTEGLSDKIIQDERNAMPNLRALQEKSISFTNYYNHTAATYRGIIGSLFSGYQLQNHDVNHLISLQSILKNEGYDTTFINVEPNNASFTRYLGNLGFNQVITKDDNQYEPIYDGEAYELLYEHLEGMKEKDKPFFTCIYTFGTHVSFESPSPEDVFGDGSSNVLNRFLYLDRRLGEFLEKFENSPMAEDTILVFTTDHCTYADEDYLDVYTDPDGAPFVDPIPLIIYYKGVQPRQIDAYGRNSLDLAPTICDLLDVTAENYYLGETLFAGIGEIDNDFDTVTCFGANMWSTYQAKVGPLETGQKNVLEKKISEYYALALGTEVSLK